MKQIPFYQLDHFSRWGIFVRNMFDGQEDPRTTHAHRDENYIFMLQESGTNTIMVDFKPVTLTAQTAYCILPGQVHRNLDSYDPKGYLIAVNADLIPPDIRPLFEQSQAVPEPIPFAVPWLQGVEHGIGLLVTMLARNGEGIHDARIIKSTAALLATMFGAILTEHKVTSEKEHKQRSLTWEFKSHLKKAYKTMKTPKAYADQLNVSPAYLNQVVKKRTGMPLSYWIVQEIILEAKRLLYYTELTVKEIAYALGYEDPTYFSRLFRKSTGQTPLSFRQYSRL